jgi:hypothetical protein
MILEEGKHVVGCKGCGNDFIIEVEIQKWYHIMYNKRLNNETYQKSKNIQHADKTSWWDRFIVWLTHVRC